MKKSPKIVISVLVGAMALSVFAYDKKGKPIVQDEQVILDTFKWFNDISSKQKKTFSKEEVAKHFDKHAKMITNGKLVCSGIGEHYDHFLELNRHYASLHAVIENMDIRKSGDRYYLHYLIEGENIQGQSVKMHIMGYMVVHHDRIFEFQEVVAKEAIG